VTALVYRCFSENDDYPAPSRLRPAKATFYRICREADSQAWDRYQGRGYGIARSGSFVA
jgi:hypothetical protein